MPAGRIRLTPGMRHRKKAQPGVRDGQPPPRLGTFSTARLSHRPQTTMAAPTTATWSSLVRAIGRSLLLGSREMASVMIPSGEELKEVSRLDDPAAGEATGDGAGSIGTHPNSSQSAWMAGCTGSGALRVERAASAARTKWITVTRVAATIRAIAALAYGRALRYGGAPLTATGTPICAGSVTAVGCFGSRTPSIASAAMRGVRQR